MLKKKSSYSKISCRLSTYIYTCVLCTHIRIFVCQDLVHLAEIDLLHTELVILLQKFTASSGVVSCGNLLFEQVQSSHIRNSKKNRKLLRVLAIYHKYWIDHQPFHESHTEADFQTFWEEDFQSYKQGV